MPKVKTPQLQNHFLPTYVHVCCIPQRIAVNPNSSKQVQDMCVIFVHLVYLTNIYVSQNNKEKRKLVELSKLFKKTMDKKILLMSNWVSDMSVKGMLII